MELSGSRPHENIIQDGPWVDGPQQKASDGSLPTSMSDKSHVQSEIVYHYLTFDTNLPLPLENPSSSNADSSPPTPPDLSKLQNPLQWSYAKKSVHIWISTVATCFTAYGAGGYVPGVDQMSQEWGVSRVATLVGVTMFTIGFGIAPMVLAPFSELNGRQPVFVVAGVIFLVLQICCAVTHAYGGMLISRFIAGCSSSTFSTMVGGVVADIYEAKNRNTPMTIFTGGVLFGTGLGPMVASFIAQHLDWRWIWWTHSMVVGAIIVSILLFFKETRGSVILSRRAKKLNLWIEEREQSGYYGFSMSAEGDTEKQDTQRIRWKVKADEERGSLIHMIAVSLYRPFHLLFTEPVVFAFSLWLSFAWAVLYLTFSAIPYVFETTYNFELQETGAVFASISISSVIFTVISIYQEKYLSGRGKLDTAPEGRLYFACLQSPLLPIGLFLFGWTGATASVHWIVPTIGVGLATTGIFSIYLATFNYLADSYHIYASSAIAAQSFCRNMLGGAFPLFTEQMFITLGIGPASSLLGGISVLLTFVPWILWLYGSRIRARSKIASALFKEYGNK